MKIRNYRHDDCKGALKLFYDTVHSVNTADYTSIQLDAWAPKEMDSVAWNKRLSSNYTVVLMSSDKKIYRMKSATDAGFYIYRNKFLSFWRDKNLFRLSILDKKMYRLL